ncbi:MAG: hypothetical protein KA732_13270 [Providencia sp.]|uniref:hypothetical protein n=1 Tax=Providencia sp. TaxID=589 RepID=UPI001B6F26D5|nr:hypothetical protein [Providencia sp.]MBP6082234.1 hypothetical protein [Providencia sp.]
MIWLIAYGLALLLIVMIYCFKGWYKLTYEPLTSQKLFWAAIFIPLLSFLYFGLFSWVGHSVDMSAKGLNTFITISKLPLGLLSLSIPLVAIITSLHRSLQTATQISTANIQIGLVKEKNSLDELFSREKNFSDKCEHIGKQVGSVCIKLKDSIGTVKFNISAPYTLFHKIYNTAPGVNNVKYELTDFLRWKILVDISTIEENLKYHYEIIDKNEITTAIDDDMPRLFAIAKALCNSFDILSIPICLVPYFYIKGGNGDYQLFFGSEEEFKMLLRKYITLIESLLSVVNFSDKYSLFYMKKYTFEGFLLFPSFKKGVITNDYISINWGNTVNAFKGSAN